MSICDEPMYSCGGVTRKAVTGAAKAKTIAVTSDRMIRLTSGSLAVDIQTRKRNLAYEDWDNYSLSNYKWVTTVHLFEPSYSPCYTVSSSSFGANLFDEFETVDAELQFLDLRYDTAVVKTVKDVLTLDGETSTAPTNNVSVFNGWFAEGFHPFILESIPIDETITYTLHANGERTELHSEQVHQGYPGVNLLMHTFPASAWGIRIDTPWAKDIEWYRQDQRKVPELDGDAFLFYPDWCRSCGQLAQDMDKLNAAIKYMLDHGETPSSTMGGLPVIAVNKAFRGSVAYDRAQNMFYSVAVPETVMVSNPDYVLKQKLVVQGAEKPIPKDKEADVWYPISIV